MMGLDVVIDPLTALGDRWFLGRIYYYPHGGLYFGVPLSNFAGWILVAFCIIGIYQRLEKKVPPVFFHTKTQPHLLTLIRPYLGLFLYVGVFLFNWVITLYLKLYFLAFIDFLLLIFLAINLLNFRVKPAQKVFPPEKSNKL